MVANASPAKGEERKHLHIRLSTEDAAIYDFITLYLEVAGKAPDWYWRTVGRLEGEENDTMEELLASAFEAGVYMAREHADQVRLEWVTSKECESERRNEVKSAVPEESRLRERSALSHYA
jgi:hypothetical protein